MQLSPLFSKSLRLNLLIGLLFFHFGCSSSEKLESSLLESNLEQSSQLPPSSAAVNKEEIELFPDVKPKIVGGFKAANKEIDYPAELRKNRIEGEVILYFVVYTDSSIGEIIEIQNPHPKLVEEAKRVIRKLRFVPATKDGKAVNAVFEFKLTFKLQQ